MKKETGKIKEVAYAYPSSDIAVKHGKGATGCWIIRIFDASLLIAPIDALRFPYGKYSMKREG